MVYRQSVHTVSFARAINRSAIHPLKLASIAAEIRHNSIYIYTDVSESNPFTGSHRNLDAEILAGYLLNCLRSNR